MNKRGVISLLLLGAGSLLCFVSEAITLMGTKEDVIEELQEDYILVEKPKDQKEQ